MIYLDNSATTKVDERVLEAMLPYLKEEYGNPSSKYYGLATRAREAVEEARYQVAKLINAKPEEIIFTSGATESNNMIIKGVADYMKYYEQKGNHIITSKVEHKATINTCKYLNGEIYSNKDATFSLGSKSRKVDRGYRVTFLDVNCYGQVEGDTLQKAIDDETVLVSLIWGNNEIGTLNDIRALSSISHDKGILFHTDATQVVGKLPVDVKDINVDFLSLSGHKIFGPKGVGAAFIKSDDYGLPPITSLIHGGNQEEGIRGGTLAVHNIVGLGKAAELARVEFDNRSIELFKIHDYATRKLKENSVIEIIGHPDIFIPGIINIIVHDELFNNELFIKSVGNKLAVSSGSACTAGEPSHVISGIGRSQESGNVIRISLSDKCLKDDVDKIVKVLGG